ncbi:hypothetical protein B0H11DRAFT_2190713 [Mycena galericulata]|nr:hypothetical protein B0H11DRAFT_2190713 [Mycena galericulata]
MVGSREEGKLMVAAFDAADFARAGPAWPRPTKAFFAVTRKYWGKNGLQKWAVKQIQDVLYNNGKRLPTTPSSHPRILKMLIAPPPVPPHHLTITTARSTPYASTARYPPTATETSRKLHVLLIRRKILERVDPRLVQTLHVVRLREKQLLTFAALPAQLRARRVFRVWRLPERTCAAHPTSPGCRRVCAYLPIDVEDTQVRVQWPIAVQRSRTRGAAPTAACAWASRTGNRVPRVVRSDEVNAADFSTHDFPLPGRVVYIDAAEGDPRSPRVGTDGFGVTSHFRSRAPFLERVHSVAEKTKSTSQRTKR